MSKGQAGAVRSGPLAVPVYTGLSQWLPTLCEDTGLCHGQAGLQYGGPAGNWAGTVPLHPLHCRLLNQLFSDDPAIVGLITDQDVSDYRQSFVDPCQLNHLQHGENQLVDRRRCRSTPPRPLSIQGTDIEIVDSYNIWVFT